MKPLTITIHGQRKVFAVREEFSRAFPDLKLEFHARPHTSDGPDPPNLVRNSSTEIKDCRTRSNDGTMTITLGMTIGELQEYFRNSFGLEVEVFFRTGTEWAPADSLASLEKLSSAGQDAIPSNRHYS